MPLQVGQPIVRPDFHGVVESSGNFRMSVRSPLGCRFPLSQLDPCTERAPNLKGVIA